MKVLAVGVWGRSHWILDVIGRGAVRCLPANVCPADEEAYSMTGGAIVGALFGAVLGFHIVCAVAWPKLGCGNDHRELGWHIHGHRLWSDCGRRRRVHPRFAQFAEFTLRMPRHGTTRETSLVGKRRRRLQRFVSFSKPPGQFIFIVQGRRLVGIAPILLAPLSGTQRKF
jgi:hypothetical protein